MFLQAVVNVQSKKLPAAAPLQVIPAAVLSDQTDAGSFKSATVHLSDNQSLVANVKSSGQFATANVSKHLTSSSNTLSVQPALPCSYSPLKWREETRVAKSPDAL
jgi:hypothetical protein